MRRPLLAPGPCPGGHRSAYRQYAPGRQRPSSTGGLRWARLNLLVWVLLGWAGASAQTQSWQGTSFEHEVSSKFGYAAEVEFRTPIEMYSQGELLLQGALNRELAQDFNVATVARYQNGGPDDNSEMRLQLDFNYARDLPGTPLSLKARMRFHRDVPLSAPEVFATNDVRPRLGLDVELTGRLTAFGEYETRYQLDSQRKEWTRLRRTAGLEYALSDDLDLEMFYRTEARINGPAARNRTDRIVGLFVSYTLPDRRNRDWEYRNPFGRDFVN